MPKNGQRLERTGDQETDEILNEIEREGSVANLEETENESESSESEEEEDDQSGNEEEETGEESDEEESEDENSEEESEEDGSESEDEGGEDGEHPAPARRTSESTSQYENRREAYWKNKAKKLQEDIITLTKKQNQDNLKEKLKDLAEKEGIPLERLTTIVEAAAEYAGNTALSPDERKKLEQAFKYANRNVESERQDNLFAQEFRDNVLPLIRANGDDVNEVYKTLYAEAFAPKKENDYDQKTGRPSRSLVEIYIAGTAKPIKRSGESSRIRSMGRTTEKPISQMSADEIENMSDEEFDKKSDEAALSQPSLVRPNKTQAL